MHFFKSVFATVALIEAAFAFNGDATWFIPGLGACGRTNTQSDFIAALPPDQYAGGSACFRNAVVQFQGKSVQVQVVDLCPGCKSGDIDLSPAAFSQLASTDLGRIKVTWNFV